MEHQDLVNYIIEQLDAGVTEGDLLAALKDSEWEKAVISASLGSARRTRSARRGQATDPSTFDVRIQPPEHQGLTDRIVNTVHDSITEAPGILQSKSVNDLGITVAPDGEMTGEGKLVGGKQEAPIVQDGLSSTRKLVVFTIIAFVIVGIIGGSIALFMTLFNLHDRVARNVFESVAGIQSVSVRATIHPDVEEEYFINAPDGVYQVTDVSASINGTTTIFDSEESKYNLTTTVDVTARAVDSDKEWDSYASMQMRSINGQLYVRPVENTIVPFTLPEEYETSWVKVDSAAGWEWLFDPEALLEGTVPTLDGGDPLELTASDVANFRNAIRRHPFYAVEKGGSDVSDGGAKLQEYPVSIRTGELVAYIEDIRPLLLHKGMSNAMIDEMIYTVESAKDIFAAVTVGKRDQQVYGFSLTIVDADESSPRSPQLVVEIDGHNTPVTAEIPSEIVGLNKYMDSWFSQAAPVDVERQLTPDDTDGDGLSNDDEKDVYGTDPQVLDTDEDGFSDGEEVANGYNPLGDGLLITE